MKKMWKNRWLLFFLLFLASDFFYSLAAWSKGYTLKIGYNVFITPEIFLLSAGVDLIIFLCLFFYYGKSAD